MEPMKRILVTPGEPAGIGPDVCLALAAHHYNAEVILLGDKNFLQARAKALSISVELYEVDFKHPQKNGQGALGVCHIPLNAPVQCGSLNIDNAGYVFKTLEKASQLCCSQVCDALITGPVHKAILNQQQPFLGHTDYLAQLAGVSSVLMSFLSPDCIVGLATHHIPLQAVEPTLNADHLKKTIQNFHKGLIETYRISQPKIAVLGLNPHAGEQGVLGDAEERWIKPLIRALQQDGMNLCGPIPGDTAFSPDNRQQFDAFLAMYHDQGLAPIKALYFEQLVNITLGLPYLRASVDHGTALTLAGTGQASSASMHQALKMSLKLLQCT